MTSAEFFHWLDNWHNAPSKRTLVMGVLNVTPDSFSDGGCYLDPVAAVGRAKQMIDEGVDLIDIGGETTKPGSHPVRAEEQIRRTASVVVAVARLGVAVSIDTTRAAVAAAALDGGACLVNDVSGGRDDEALLPLVAVRNAAVCLMHMQGTPTTMQVDPRYDDVVRDVSTELGFYVRTARAQKIARILIDPGFGFGKTLDHNVTLLRDLNVFARQPQPVLVGLSRKGFLGTLANAKQPADRVHATAAAVTWAVTQGAAVVRVHDVAVMRQVVDVASALRGTVRPT